MAPKSLIPGSLLALLLLITGCGSDGGGDAGGEPEQPPASATNLEILVWPSGEGKSEPQRYTLTCDPPAGEHPDPAAACAALDELGAAAFAPKPPDVACTEQYGGPAQARVTGEVAGERVDARLSLTDGCEIERWSRVTAVVPGGGGGGGEV